MPASIRMKFIRENQSSHTMDGCKKAFRAYITQVCLSFNRCAVDKQNGLIDTFSKLWLFLFSNSCIYFIVRCVIVTRDIQNIVFFLNFITSIFLVQIRVHLHYETYFEYSLQYIEKANS